VDAGAGWGLAPQLLELGVITTLRDLLAGPEAGVAAPGPSAAALSASPGARTPEGAGAGATPASGSASGVLARPSEQVSELMSIVIALMPELPRDGIFAVQLNTAVTPAAASVTGGSSGPASTGAAPPLYNLRHLLRHRTARLRSC
jgi:hypothetical protein